MSINPEDFVVMHTVTNVWYYGKVKYIDDYCIGIDHASYGHGFVPPISDPPEHPNPPGGWAYFDPSTEIMWMNTALYWIAKVNKIPVLPEGGGHL